MQLRTTYGDCVVVPEGTFANAEHGFAGRYDIMLQFESRKVFLDVKTTNLSSYTKPHRKWGLQGAGYIIGTGNGESDLFEQVVVDRTSGKCVFYVWDEIPDCKRCFMSLRDAWGVLNKYEPWRKSEQAAG